MSKTPHVCRIDNTRIVDSRPEVDSVPDEAAGYVRRRRVCYECGERFTTVEIAIDEFGRYTRMRAFIAELREWTAGRVI